MVKNLNSFNILKSHTNWSEKAKPPPSYRKRGRRLQQAIHKRRDKDASMVFCFVFCFLTTVISNQRNANYKLARLAVVVVVFCFQFILCRWDCNWVKPSGKQVNNKKPKLFYSLISMHPPETGTWRRLSWKDICYSVQTKLKQPSIHQWPSGYKIQAVRI